MSIPMFGRGLRRILRAMPLNILALCRCKLLNIDIMIQTVEAIIDDSGKVKVLNDLVLPKGRRALVTVLDEASEAVSETALLSEEALATDWLREEEDEAWSHLQLDRWF